MSRLDISVDCPAERPGRRGKCRSFSVPWTAETAVQSRGTDALKFLKNLSAFGASRWREGGERMPCVRMAIHVKVETYNRKTTLCQSSGYKKIALGAPLIPHFHPRVIFFPEENSGRMFFL